ncbi:MAG: hypothetical protein AAGN82_31665 [Myxococcota bacterium]
MWKGLSLLSLDLTQPFLANMGLGGDPGTVQAAAQKVITAHLDATGWPVPSEPPPELAAQTRRALAATGADEFTAAWLEHLFVRHWGDHWSLFVWRDCLVALAHSSHPSPSEVLRPCLDELREAFDKRHLKLQVQATRFEPLTDWDLEQCVREGWTPYPRAADVYLTILLQARVKRFTEVIRRVYAELSPDEMHILDREARREGNDLGHELESTPLHKLLGLDVKKEATC